MLSRRYGIHNGVSFQLREAVRKTLSYDPRLPGFEPRVSVNNRVPIKRAVQSIADDEIKEQIERELAWNPYVRRNAVRVEVSDGAARLVGTVLDWRAYREAERSAREGGRRAWAVENSLQSLGVGDAYVDITSRGKLDATGTDDVTWAQDRRVDIKLEKPSG